MKKNLFFIILIFIINQSLLGSQERRIVLYQNVQEKQNNQAENIREQLRIIYNHCSDCNKINISKTSNAILFEKLKGIALDIERLKELGSLIKSKIEDSQYNINIIAGKINENEKLIITATKEKEEVIKERDLKKNAQKNLDRRKKTSPISFDKTTEEIDKKISNLKEKNEKLNERLGSLMVFNQELLLIAERFIAIKTPIVTLFNIIDTELKTCNTIWKPLSLNSLNKNGKTIKHF